MANVDRLLTLFLIIVIYSAIMNIILFYYLDEDVSITPHNLKEKLRGFIRRHKKILPHKDLDVNVADVGMGLNVKDLNSKMLRSESVNQQQKDNVPVDEKTKRTDTDSSNQTKEDSHSDSHSDSNDKEHIINILKTAGTTITPEIIDQIPSWTEVKSLYGDKPKIVGLDQCSRFQLEIPKNDAYLGAAGLFNTGTNLLADLVLQYCTIPNRSWRAEDHKYSTVKQPNRMKSGMLYQVPWGKHNPVSWRGQHSARLNPPEVDQTHVLPIVMIKDPYYWMGSMCRHKYAANWFHTKDHCPNLVPNEFDIGNRGITSMTKSIPVRVRYQDKQEKVSQYDSMLDLWNTWYGDYLSIEDFPRVIVRFEDLLFHPEELMREICACAGGTMKNDKNGVHLESQAAKKGTVHNGSNGLLSAIAKYGSAKHRLDGMTADDIKFTNDNVSADLMELFSYSYASIPNE